MARSFGAVQNLGRSFGAVQVSIVAVGSVLASPVRSFLHLLVRVVLLSAILSL